MLTKKYFAPHITYTLYHALVIFSGTISCSQNRHDNRNDETTRSVSRRIPTPIPSIQANPAPRVLATPLLIQEQPQTQTLPHMTHVRTTAFLPPILNSPDLRGTSSQMHKMISIAHQECCNPNYLDILDHDTKDLYLQKIGIIIDHLARLKSHFPTLQSLIHLHHTNLYESSDEIVTRSLCNLPLQLKALAVSKNPMLLHKVTNPKIIIDQCATKLKTTSKHPIQKTHDAVYIAIILKALYQEGDLDTINYMQETLPDEHDQGFIPTIKPNVQYLQNLANNDCVAFINTLATTTHPDETITILEDILANHFKIPSGLTVTCIYKTLVNNKLPVLPIYKAWIYHKLQASNTQIDKYRYHSPKLFIWLKEIEETYPTQIQHSRHGISPETCQQIIQDINQHPNVETVRRLLQDLEDQSFTTETTELLQQYVSNPDLKKYLENCISGLFAAYQRDVFVKFVIWRYQNNAEPLASLLHPYEISTKLNPHAAFFRQFFKRNSLRHNVLPLLHEDLSQEKSLVTVQQESYADTLFEAITRNTSTYYNVLDKNSRVTVLELLKKYQLTVLDKNSSVTVSEPLSQHQLLDFKYTGIQYPYNSKPITFAINQLADQALTDMYLYLTEHPNQNLAWHSFEHALDVCLQQFINDTITSHDLSDHYRPSLKILQISTLFCRDLLQKPDIQKQIVTSIQEWIPVIQKALQNSNVVPCSRHTLPEHQCFECIQGSIASYPWINDITKILKKYGNCDLQEALATPTSTF